MNESRRNLAENDALTLVHDAIDLTLHRATALIGPDVSAYIPVFRRAIEIIVKLIRERGHRETLTLLDTLAAMPMEKL